MSEAETRRFASAMTQKVMSAGPWTFDQVVLQVIVDTDLLLDPDNDLTIADWEQAPTGDVVAQMEDLEAQRREGVIARRPNPGLTFASNPWPDRLIAGAYVLAVVVLGIMAAMWLATL